MFLCATLIAGSAQAQAGQPETPAGPDSLQRQLEAVRLNFSLLDRGFAGPGWQLILDAAGRARYIAIGEDHLTREIPAFVGALCDAFGARLSAMAVEAGPDAAAFVAANMRAPDHDARMAALIARYPDSVAFLNIEAENDLVSHCARSSGPGFQLWGLDQEFIGAAGRLLDEALARPLSTAARAALLHLRAEEAADARQAEHTGDPADLFVFKTDDPELASADRLVSQGPDETAGRLVGSLLATRQIYRENLAGSPESKLDRALLLKRNMATHLAASGDNGGTILFKFGDWHLYRGYNPLDERDLGNAIAEYADLHGSASLHIAVLGVRGVHARYGGYARPLLHIPFFMSNDPDYQWIEDAVDAAEPARWTVFDLRRLRTPEQKNVPLAWRRMIDGYDLLVLVPEITPADPVHP